MNIEKEYVFPLAVFAEQCFVGRRKHWGRVLFLANFPTDKTFPLCTNFGLSRQTSQRCKAFAELRCSQDTQQTPLPFGWTCQAQHIEASRCSHQVAKWKVAEFCRFPAVEAVAPNPVACQVAKLPRCWQQIVGRLGTGKNLVQRAFHQQRPRGTMPKLGC